MSCLNLLESLKLMILAVILTAGKKKLNQLPGEQRLMLHRGRRALLIEAFLLAMSLSCEAFLLADLLPELLTKSAFKLWKHFITDEILVEILKQNVLYARREKNRPNIDV